MTMTVMMNHIIQIMINKMMMTMTILLMVMMMTKPHRITHQYNMLVTYNTMTMTNNPGYPIMTTTIMATCHWWPIRTLWDHPQLVTRVMIWKKE